MLKLVCMGIAKSAERLRIPLRSNSDYCVSSISAVDTMLLVVISSDISPRIAAYAIEISMTLINNLRIPGGGSQVVSPGADAESAYRPRRRIHRLLGISAVQEVVPSETDIGLYHQ